MYNQEIKAIEEAIKKTAENIKIMLSGIAAQSFTKEELEDINNRMNALVECSGKVTQDNLLDVSIAVKYLQKLIDRIRSSHPSMEDSLCEFYTAILHHSPELRLIFEQLGDEQKIDLTEAIKDIGGIEIKNAIVTKAQVLAYLKKKG